jgi:hypothetical protein
LRTYEDIEREVGLLNKLRWDVIAFTHGKFERHASLDYIPRKGASYPTCVEDLPVVCSEMDMLGGVRHALLKQAIERVTGKPFPLGSGLATWSHLWEAVRSMRVYNDLPTTGRPPRLTRPRLEVTPGKRGTYHLRGTRRISLLYVPGQIEAMDVKFIHLGETARWVITTIITMAPGQTDFTIAEIVNLLGAVKPPAKREAKPPANLLQSSLTKLVGQGFMKYLKVPSKGLVAKAKAALRRVKLMRARVRKLKHA